MIIQANCSQALDHKLRFSFVFHGEGSLGGEGADREGGSERDGEGGNSRKRGTILSWGGTW